MSPESYFTQLSVPLARTAQNFAPRKPLDDTVRNKKLPKTPTKFEQSIREWYQSKLNYEKLAWEEMISMAQLVAMFRKGQQLLVRRPYGPGYYVRPVKDDSTDRQTAMNLMSFHSQVSEAKVIASNPTVSMRAGDDTPEAIAAAQACRPTVDNYETEWYTAKFSRREAIRFLTDGMVIHQVRWNPFKGGYEVQERKVSRQEVMIDPGAGICADCQHEADADEFQPSEYGNKCPNCGSEAVDVRKSVKQNLPQIGMGAKKLAGEPEIISSPFASWRWDLSRDLELSSWAIKRQRITQGAINLMLGNVTVPDSASSEDYGLELVHAVTYGGQAFQGISHTANNQSQWDKRPTMVEAWMSAEDQATIECEEGDTICGVTMPKGRMSDFFKGAPVCLVGLNDMSLIVGTFANESHMQEVETAQWFMDAESGGGRGMEDTAAVQKRFNAVDGHVYKGLATTATPPVFVDMRMIKEDTGQYLFKPGVNHDVNLSMLPVGMKLPDAIYMPSPGAVSQQYIQYGSQFLMQMLTMSSLSVDFSENVLPVDNRTATGAQITAQLANSLYGPMLISKGESRVGIAKKIVSLVAKHGVASRFFPGKSNARGRSVSGQDLKGKVIFELVENSHLPVTPFSQQSDVQNMFLAYGNAQVAMEIKKADPEFFRATSKPYNINWGSESDDSISTLCLSRLEQMKQALQAGVDDPNMLTQMIRPPVSMYEPKQAEKKQWWSDWLDLDSAQKSPQVLRQAAEAMYNLHLNLETQRQMPESVNEGLVAGLGQAAAAAPSALGAQALQQNAPQTQDDQELGLEAEHAMQQEEQDQEVKLKGMESHTAIRVAEIQGESQLKNTKLAGENQLKVAKAKPKKVA
jgi:hypothetical protein